MKRASWAILDQGAAALGSLVITIFVARTASVAEFGVIAGAQLVIALGVQGFRQTVGSTMLRHPGGPVNLNSANFVIALAVGASLIAFLAGWVVGILSLPVAAAGAVATAAALLQERGRVALQAARRNHVAATRGLVVLVLIVVASIGSLAVGVPYWGPWLASSCVMLGSWGWWERARLGVRGAAPRQLWKTNGREWRASGGAFSIQALSTFAPTLVLGAFVGAQAVGAMRGALALVAIAQQIPQSLYPLFMTLGAGRGGMLPRLALWVGAQVVTFGGLGALIVAMGEEIGPLLLGATWLAADDVVGIMLVASFIAAVSMGLEIQLRLARNFKAMFRVRVLVLPFQLILLVSLTVGFGLVGAAWAAVCSGVLVLIGLGRHVVWPRKAM